MIDLQRRRWPSRSAKASGPPSSAARSRRDVLAGLRAGVLGLPRSADTSPLRLILSDFSAEHFVELLEVPGVAEDDFHVDYIREVGARRVAYAAKI